MISDGRVYIVKSGGKRPIEEFNPDKLHRSIVATCLSLNTPEGQAEQVAESVCLGVMQWCGERPEITSSDIRRIGANILQKHHPEAAYIYRQQLNVL